MKRHQSKWKFKTSHFWIGIYSKVKISGLDTSVTSSKFVDKKNQQLSKKGILKWLLFGTA